jgi:hypothetical protein
VDLKVALDEIELYKPFANASCMRCHSGRGKLWLAVPDHHSGVEDVRSGKVSCVGQGCHGPAHPFSKPKHQLAHQEPSP